MSDDLDPACQAAIEYRSFVVAFVKELSPEEIYEISYIWLRGRGDCSVYEPSKKSKKSGLELFATLEYFGKFSQKRIGGLIDIAKRINRFDLVDRVKDFKKKSKNYLTKATKKIVSSASEERRELKFTFEKMVVDAAVLEQYISLLQDILQSSDDAHVLDEGTEIVDLSSELIHSLASKLRNVQKKLPNSSRSRSGSEASSSSSGSSDSGGSRRNSSLLVRIRKTDESVLMDEGIQNATQQTGHLVREQTQSVATPLQESATNHPTRGQHGYYTAAPARPELTFTKSCPPVISSNTPLEVVLEGDDDDQTGDSGVGTGSDSGDRNAWRNAIKDPPPVNSKTKVESLYTALKEGTTDEDPVYQQVDNNI